MFEVEQSRRRSEIMVNPSCISSGLCWTSRPLVCASSPCWGHSAGSLSEWSWHFRVIRGPAFGLSDLDGACGPRKDNNDVGRAGQWPVLDVFISAKSRVPTGKVSICLSQQGQIPDGTITIYRMSSGTAPRQSACTTFGDCRPVSVAEDCHFRRRSGINSSLLAIQTLPTDMLTTCWHVPSGGVF